MTRREAIAARPTLPSCRPVREGFTLIELLVVIAILALLVAMLLPSLKHARDLARTAVCISNANQLGNATYAYCAENDRWLPNGVGAEAGDCRGGWMGHVAPYMYQTDNWNDSQIPYNPGGLGALICPSVELIDASLHVDAVPGQTVVGYYKRISSSYGAVKPFIGCGTHTGDTNVFLPNGKESSARISSPYVSPAQNIVFAGYADDHTRWAANAFRLGHAPKLALIHQLRSTCLYMDGHVQTHDALYLDRNKNPLTWLRYTPCPDEVIE